MNKAVLDRSIVIIGPVGVGKSLSSFALGKATGMPVITTDLLRHCPKTVKQIQFVQDKVRENIRTTQKELENATDDKTKKDLEQKLKKLKNDDWVCERQKEMRKILPKVPNYKEMGFNGDISNFARSLGDVAWHFYQKQFENRMLTCIVDQLDTPAIVDMGGGMAVSLDDEYSKIAEQVSVQYPDQYRDNMNMDYVGFDIICRELAKCPNVVNLVLPQDYKNMDKAKGNQTLNDKFVSSGQFEKLANISIPVDGLINGNTYNPEVLKQIVDKIQASQDRSM